MSATSATQPISMFDWQAQHTLESANMFAHAIKTTEADKLDWCPACDEKSKSRSALDQVSECVGVNYGIAKILRGEESPESAEPLKFANADEAYNAIFASARDLANTIKGLSPEQLNRNYALWSMELPGYVVVSIPGMNMMYHAGQVNYIQTLYGDEKFSIPGPVPEE